MGVLIPLLKLASSIISSPSRLSGTCSLVVLWAVCEGLFLTWFTSFFGKMLDSVYSVMLGIFWCLVNKSIAGTALQWYFSVTASINSSWYLLLLFVSSLYLAIGLNMALLYVTSTLSYFSSYLSTLHCTWLHNLIGNKLVVKSVAYLQMCWWTGWQPTSVVHIL